MNNKTLAMFSLVPLWFIGIVGFLEGYTGEILMSEGMSLMFGFIMFVFITWAGVRLYRL